MKTNSTYQDFEPGYTATENEFMQDWVFHYNAYTKTWAAIPRELYVQYWSNASLKGILRSNSIDTLIEILYKTKGDESKMKKLISE